MFASIITISGSYPLNSILICQLKNTEVWELAFSKQLVEAYGVKSGLKKKRGSALTLLLPLKAI